VKTIESMGTFDERISSGIDEKRHCDRPRNAWTGNTFAQDNDLAQATALNQQVIQLYRQGRYPTVFPQRRRCWRLLRKALGFEHPDVTESLYGLARIQRQLAALDCISFLRQTQIEAEYFSRPAGSGPRRHVGC
jgi:hypothetical protein